MQAFVVDAFTDRPFAGNPAAVCLGTAASGDRLGDKGWMQAVAAEFNLAETAFLAGGPGVYDLRWFTPQVEVDLCGHATLASAHVLWETGEVADVLQFRTRSGILTAERTTAGITLGLPADTATPVAEGAGPLLAALGLGSVGARDISGGSGSTCHQRSRGSRGRCHPPRAGSPGRALRSAMWRGHLPPAVAVVAALAHRMSSVRSLLVGRLDRTARRAGTAAGSPRHRAAWPRSRRPAGPGSAPGRARGRPAQARGSRPPPAIANTGLYGQGS